MAFRETTEAAAIFSDEQPVTDVSVTELAQTTSAVVERVVSGERVIVTRGRKAVAVLLSLDDGIDAMLAGSERLTMLRREARAELDAGVAAALSEWRASRSS